MTCMVFRAEAEMDRSLHAPLGPNEELALRRIAHGIVGSRELSKRIVDHLIALDLISEKNGAVAYRIGCVPRREASPHGRQHAPRH
jgi:hypothetical protein